MITEEHIQKFLEQAHRVGDAALTICSSGNLSWRIGDEALVSGTGSWVPSLQKEKVSQCLVATGEVLNGVKPSMESGFHLGVLRERPDCDVVLHFQSPFATAVACMQETPKDFNVTAEVPCHVGKEIPFFLTILHVHQNWQQPVSLHLKTTIQHSCSSMVRWFAERISTRCSSVPCSLRWLVESSFRVAANTPH